jgi:hypothetical protein
MNASSFWMQPFFLDFQICRWTESYLLQSSWIIITENKQEKAQAPIKMNFLKQIYFDERGFFSWKRIELWVLWAPGLEANQEFQRLK